MPIPKFIARDCELSTNGIDVNDQPIDSWKATQRILAQIDAALRGRGAVAWSRNTSWSASPYSMDCLRHWTSAGQCYYSDMGHVEVCSAAVLQPSEFAAQCISLVLAAEEARRLAEEEDDVQYTLSASNADVLDPAISWGTHLNVAITSELWEDLFVEHTHPARLGFVASAMAAGIAFFGAGHLLPMKDGATVYSLSARAHHLSKVHTQATTEAFRRGLLNTRREPHGKDHERLHLIGFDFSIASAALLATYVQCVLSAAEESYCGMSLYDPVRALRTWSWNLDLQTGRLPAEATLVDGRKLTLPAYMRELVTRLLEMCECGLISTEVAPEASELLPRIIELTSYAGEGSVKRCARHLDWASKLMCLIAHEEPLGSPASRIADHDFLNTDPRRGAIWKLWEEEMIDPLVDRQQAEAFLVHPPAGSRAWGRGNLIKRFFDRIADVDWSYVSLYRGADRWNPQLRIETPHLDSLNRAEFGQILERADSVEYLHDLLQQRSRGGVEVSDPLDNIPPHLATLNEADKN